MDAIIKAFEHVKATTFTIILQCRSQKCIWLPKSLLKLFLRHRGCSFSSYLFWDMQIRLHKYFGEHKMKNRSNGTEPNSPATSWAWTCLDASLHFSFFWCSCFFLALEHFLFDPQHKQHDFGQQLHVLLGGFVAVGASYPYKACLLKTQPVPTYIGPWIPSRPFMLICTEK